MTHRIDLGRTVFAVLFIVGLLVASLWILRPFIGSLLWAVMIVIATWPLLLRLQERLFGNRALAVAGMVLVLLLVLVLPVTMVVGTLVTHADVLVGWASELQHFHVPAPPAWLLKIPAAGAHLHGLWEQFSLLSNQELIDRAAPYAQRFMAWLLPQIGTFGFVLVQFLLTVIIAAICYLQGEAVAAFIRRFGLRLAGERGESAVRLAAQTIRGVALGVVGTAMIQSALAGIGFAIAHVPLAGLLTAFAFVMTVAQLPVLLVMIPAVIWVFATGSHGLGIFLLIWTVVVSTVDNFIRPLLIQRGANLPFLLIFAGVIGGLLSFGVIGVFAGPVVLAVSWRLFAAWVDHEPEREPAS